MFEFLNRFLDSLSRGDADAWFWLIITPLAVFGMIVRPQSLFEGKGDDGGGSGSIGDGDF